MFMLCTLIKKCTKIAENQIPYWFLTGMVIRLKKYSLDTDAYYIAVDSTQQSLFAAVKNSSSGWKIICYALD